MADIGRYLDDRIINRPDSVAAGVAELGDPWSFLVVREAFYGVRRFTDLHRNLGIARNILSDRLSLLVERGILERRPSSRSPARSDYHLTQKGRELYPVAVAFIQWADRWVVGGSRLPLRHRGCGGHVEVAVQCQACHAQVGPREVSQPEEGLDGPAG